MEETRVTKDAEVEVCTEEEGFEGAWFRAVLEDNPTNSGRRKVRVRYTTLLTDDGLSPLTEIIDQKLIRPVPPENLYTGVVLEEGIVVDAYHRDAWWTGVVIKKNLEDDNYLVLFDSPPDIIQFERNQLRAHLQWTGSEWVHPDIQELDRSMFCSGTMVEVSYVDKEEVTWFPAMIVKEIEEYDGEKKFIVKECSKHLSCNGDDARANTTVGSCRVRPKQPSSSVEKYDLVERVEAFHGSGWRQGLVRRILSDNRYRVDLEGTKEQIDFEHSDLRPFMVWEDGIWLKRSKKPVKETPTNVIRMKPTRSSSGDKPMTHKKARKYMNAKLKNPEGNGETLTGAETVAATGELGKKRADAVMIDKTPRVITPPVTSIARGSVSPVNPSPATSLKQKETGTKGKKSSEIGLGNDDSTPQKMPEEENTEEKSRKRKREEKQHSDLKETTAKTCNGSEAEVNDTSKQICNDDGVDDQPLSACIANLSTAASTDQSSNVMMESAVEETRAKDTLMALPFEKKLSPYWKTLDGFKSKPPRPHFTPLLEGAKEDFREWAAVGMMVSYYALLEEVKDLKPDDPKSIFTSLSVSFTELEKHGFEVSEPQSRIGKVLSIKDGLAKKAEERMCVENKLEEVKSKKRKLEEDMAEFKLKILELERQVSVAKEEKEAAEKMMVEMQSNGETINQEIEDAKLEFQTTLSAPW